MRTCRYRMLKPQRASCNGWINPSFLPPRGGFIAAAMHFAMVSLARRCSELIAYLAPHCPALREAQVVGVRRLTTTYQTRLLSDHVGRDRGPAPGAAQVKPMRSCRSHWIALPFARSGAAHLRLTSEAHLHEARESRLEGLFDATGIVSLQLIFFGERPVRPKRSLVTGCQLIHSAEKSIAQRCRRFEPPSGDSVELD
jgi:hypothetical protein